jgi:hypothetical protein
MVKKSGHDQLPMLRQEFFPRGFLFAIGRGLNPVSHQDVGDGAASEFVPKMDSAPCMRR